MSAVWAFDEAEATHADGVVLMRVGDQTFGIEVAHVRDVFAPRRITRVPRASAEIVGVLNLRGRIVTAVDLAARLGLGATVRAPMGVVVEHGGEWFCLLVDAVADVVDLPSACIEAHPANLEARLRDASRGIAIHDDRLVIILAVERLFGAGSGPTETEPGQ